MAKIITWISVNVVSILGFVQVAIKFIKEVCTLAVNILFPLFVDGGKLETIVLKVRAFVEKADAVVERIKAFLLKGQL